MEATAPGHTTTYEGERTLLAGIAMASTRRRQQRAPQGMISTREGTLIILLIYESVAPTPTSNRASLLILFLCPSYNNLVFRILH